MTAKVSDGEFAVLKVLQELRTGTVTSVRERFNERHGRILAYNTLLTFLKRLEQKGAVRVDKEREPYVYRPAQREKTSLRERVQGFVDTVFDGRMADLVLHLLEDDAISTEELSRLQEKVQLQQKAREPAVPKPAQQPSDAKKRPTPSAAGVRPKRKGKQS